MNKKITTLSKELIYTLYKFKYHIIRYRVLSQVITLILLAPLMNTLLKLLMGFKGYGSLTNGLLSKYIFSPAGIASAIVLFCMVTCIILIEIGGLIIVSNQAYGKKTISNSLTIMRYSLKHFFKMCGVGGLFIFLYIVILSPILNIGPSTSLLSELQIPGFIMDVIVDNKLYNTLLIILTITASIFALLVSLSLHYILLKGYSSMKAIKSSISSITKNIKLSIKYIVGVSLITGVAIIIIISVFALAGLLLTLKIKSWVLGAILGLLLVAVIVMVVIIFVPFRIYLLTMLFYSIEEYDDLDIEERKKNTLVSILKNLTIIAIIVTALLVLVTYIVYVIYENYDVDITAHRGSSVRAPENSLSSLEFAIEDGADYAEIDVQEIKDGNIVLIHDKKVDRTTDGEGYIWDYTLSDLKRLDSGSWFSDEFKGERIPTLQEAIDLTKGRLKLNIELKSHEEAKSLVKSVVKVIKDNNLEKECVVTSLEYELLMEVERISPEIKTGYIMFVAFGDLSELKVDFYSIEASGLDEDFVVAAHAIGRDVHTWTINKTEDLNEVLLTGVDNVITDHVAETKAHIENENKDSADIRYTINTLLKNFEKELD